MSEVNLRLFSILYVAYFLSIFAYLDVSSFLTTSSFYTPSFMVYDPGNLDVARLIFTAILLVLFLSLWDKNVVYLTLGFVVTRVIFLFYPALLVSLISSLFLSGIYLALAFKTRSWLWGVSALSFPLGVFNFYFYILIIPSIIAAFLYYRSSHTEEPSFPNRFPGS
ncbi:hypothetical protein IC006_0954 [Sulfuracidifex tepidarius]|uniref:Uncharacterized protein n=1 Tax=Sulfuracidifex tepidarius TaxID=1294262 RepID=A0A510DTW2_9CREN|nr:hypothetical protein IC006_0954 [Sulfuracidifex tepidarius]